MFKDARRPTGLSGEKAAGLLHIGTRTLVDYENFRTTVPPEIALAMGRVYDDPVLPARYCSEYCPIGQETAQPVTVKGLTDAVLSLVKSLAHMHETRDRLIEIAGDGQVSGRDVTDFARVLKHLEDIERAIETLKLWARKHLAGCQEAAKKEAACG